MAEQKGNRTSSEQESTSQAQSQSRAMQRRGTERLRAPAFNMPDILDPFSTFRRMLTPFSSPGITESAIAPVTAWMPTIEIEERDGKLVVTADLPGLAENDVSVVITDNTLVIEGERTFEREESEGNIRRSERQYGHFYRAVPLPEDVDADRVEARIRSGVLEVTVPLPQKQRERRQIPIQGEGEKRAETASQKGETKKAA